MKYMGSKAKIKKYILPIILEQRKTNQIYYEPFAGGMNVITDISGPKIANDKNHFLIEMWKGLIKGNKYPDIISKELYSAARDMYNNRADKDFSDDLIGWIGWMASYNGRFFDGGYSGHFVNGRDYIGEQIRNTLKQVDNLKDTIFLSGEYFDYTLNEPAVIYADPPYKGTKQYVTSKNFDHDKFWNWCRDMRKKGHYIFISEYEAPDDFTCIWSKEVTNSLNTTKTYKPTEKLFI